MKDATQIVPAQRRGRRDRRSVVGLVALTVLIVVAGTAAMLDTIRDIELHLPAPPVEAVIALSIVFLATELVHTRTGRPSWTASHAWVVAFAFGLLHGLGFAGALADIGLPAGQIPLALFQFNLGVELGQLGFLAAVAAGLALWERLPVPHPRWAWRLPAYSIGTLASFWTLQRVAGFWS